MEVRTKAELEIMRRASMVVYEVLQTLKEFVSPGVTTRDLNSKAAELTKQKGVRAAFLNYPSSTQGVPPFSGVICASRNSAIVHGLPDDLPLKEGDIISIDYGCELDGFFGDSAITVKVGAVDERTEELLKVTQQSLEDAILQCIPGKRIGDIGYAVQSRVEKHGFGVVKEFVGHGIGRKMHQPPQVPNFGKPGSGRPLRAGMVLAIEPMVTIGSPETVVLEDGWTAVTKDASNAAHFEHTVAITNGKPWVLSRP